MAGRWRDGIQSGLRSAQPAFGSVAIGTLYFVTDEGVLERSTGAAWVEVAINETAHDALDHTGLTGVGGASELDYAERTSNLNVTATAEASADTIVTGASVAYDGSTIVVVEFYAMAVLADATAAGRQISIYLFEDGSSIGRMALRTSQAANNNHSPVQASRRLTPSNASHTYSVRATVSAGSGIVSAGAGGSGASMPAFLRITRA